MKKLVTALAITIVMVGVASGLLFYQYSKMQIQNNLLEDQISEYQRSINQFEAQILEVENQNVNLQNQISELEQLTNELQSVIDENTDIVNITEFTVSGFNPMVGVTIMSHANINIENNGINDVTDISLILDCLPANDSQSFTIEVIHPRENIQITKNLLWNLGFSPTWSVTLSKDDKILDSSSADFSP